MNIELETAAPKPSPSAYPFALEGKPPPMKIALTSIYVNDPSDAFQFYTSVLGFVERVYMPEQNLAIVAAPDAPDETGLLLEPNDNPIAKNYQQALYEGGYPALVLGVEDIHQEYERLSDLGVAFWEAPTPTETEDIAALFEDTCGNLIQLYQTA